MNRSSLFSVLFCLIPVVGCCEPIPEVQDVYADLRKDPRIDRLLTTWQELLGTGDQPIFDPEMRKKAEWLRENRAELAPVLVEIVRRDPISQNRADAIASCVYPSMDKTAMIEEIRSNLPEWFDHLPYKVDNGYPNSSFIWSCCGYLADFGDQNDLELLGRLAKSDNPEKAPWAEIANKKMAFLRKRLTKENRRQGRKDDEPALRPDGSGRENRNPTPAFPGDASSGQSSNPWIIPLATIAMLLLLLGSALAFRARRRRKDHDPHGAED
jgi:hypothetical protein